MKRLVLNTFFSFITLVGLAEGPDIESLREFTVWGHRPLRDLGLQRSEVDSAALKENIALSMADVLTYNTSIFVKQAGRATLSTVSMRGTSPSHTQVNWNGMRINSPMLGMTDFSTIPSFFVDRATVLHGTSSVGETGGGLGGLISLTTITDVAEGLHAQYVQGVGSFCTFDEFAKITYGTQRIKSATRVSVASSANNYKYTNHDKYDNIYDADNQIIGRYHPVERNRSGAFTDVNVMHDLAWNVTASDLVRVSAWYTHSYRLLPMLTTDYGDARDFLNRQKERTLRSVASWSHNDKTWKSAIRVGYTHTEMAYDYRRELSEGNWSEMTRSRSTVNTILGAAEGQWLPVNRLMFNASATMYQHFVRSRDKNVLFSDGGKNVVGYDKARSEFSAMLSAKYQPWQRLGLGTTLRQEVCGNRVPKPIPAFFVDGLISRRGNIMAKASVSGNHRFPTLNDMYFLPGGNPDLRNEKGWTYDAGVTCDTSLPLPFATSVGGGVTWFQSRITDWIIWLPTAKGFFSPRNMHKVGSHGIESRMQLVTEPWRGWVFDIAATYSWTPSVNLGPALSEDDRSVGSQLPYIPCHSASINGSLTWQRWKFNYRWAYYSQRYTMSSSDHTITGYLPPYYMSNVSLSRLIPLRKVTLQAKLAVNNLFNEDYLSVLSRPMPGINGEIFLSINY